VCFIVRIPFVSGEDDKIKRCPLCRVPIERNDGCAQMMCKNCKHVFCWFCLTSLDVRLNRAQLSIKILVNQLLINNIVYPLLINIIVNQYHS